MKKVCLLTGASGLLGTAFCRQFADEYEIVAIYRTHLPEVPSQGQRFIDPLHSETEVAENEHPVFAIKSDLTQDCQPARVVELALARFGRVDLLVNAAIDYLLSPILRSNRLLDNAERQFRLNTIVPLQLAAIIAEEFWSHRCEENAACNRNVINISSTAGLRLYPGSGRSIYGASKAALNLLTQYMADEFAEIGIRVNALAPDTFPDLVPTENVLQAMAHLDQGDMTGTIMTTE